MKVKTLIEASNRVDLSSIMNDDLMLLNNIFQRNGFELRIVGGAVRDILSGKDPKDIDLASDATPQEVMDLLKSEDIRVIETGLQHGTITANMNSEDYEITTLRIDRETDGRHAEVEYTRDWEQDALRRDLTFNAMSIDFDGTLYDYHGGQDDLNTGTAKFVGNADQRMQEDFLRILRYFRFQGRMDKPTFDDETIKSIASNASGLDRISGERIWAEVEKILSGNNVSEILSKMKSTGVLDQIGLKSTGEFSKVKNHTNNSNLLLASMLGSVGELDKLRERWKFSNPEYNVMKFVIRNRDKDYKLEDLKKMVAVDRVSPELVHNLLEYRGQLDKLGQMKNWAAPKFPVSGNDLKSAGIEPGPEMGKILSNLRNSWAKSGYKLDREQLLGQVQ
jgi:tRNA nucleotidyltransferase (CCA-adding enzyme)